MNISYAIVSAFERLKEPNKDKLPSTQLFIMALTCVFFVVLASGVASGALMYKHVADTQVGVNNSHLQSGLIANIVRANDSVDSVTSGEGPEGESLVLLDENNGTAYETRLYQHDGAIMQESTVSGRDYAPLRATSLIESDTFNFSFDGKTLTLTTDQGSVDVTLRSHQGGSL